MLSERLGELNRLLPIVKVVLFGSYARGGRTVRSDIDILVIYKGEIRDDAYALTRKVLAIPRLEPHLYTEEEYETMKETVDKMIAGGVNVQWRKSCPESGT